MKDLELPVDDLTVSGYQTDDLVERLREFARGEPTDFSDVAVETRGATSFQRRVIDACRAIPWGETRSYGQLARSVGRPGAARAVGSVMAANRVPLVVPCHRVVAAAGGLGGFSAPQGVAMKRRLLAAEQRVSVGQQLIAG
ncbi:MAG: MGMT family protein [Planctomycetes bacterium]|nr:MGMT family protein [Planctomycetota bacterium]